jgi:hypothetical protein
MNGFEKMTFRQFVENCEALKSQYEEVLSPFFNVQLVRCWKKMIYGLNIEEWKKDRLWEYLNDDVPIELLKKLV